MDELYTEPELSNDDLIELFDEPLDVGDHGCVRCLGKYN